MRANTLTNSLRYFLLLTLSPSIICGAVSTDSLFLAGELIGRPTDRSITINALADVDLEVYFIYGTKSDVYDMQTQTSTFNAGNPIEVVIGGLEPNTRYYYRMCYRTSGAADFITKDEHCFHTQRAQGVGFTFAVHADPHLDQNSNPEVYEKTMMNTREDRPDFLIDLGDNFMSDKIPVIYPEKNITYEEVMNRLLLLRSYYDLVAHSSPLFLVIGNHEGEQGWRLDGSAENLAIWATNARKLLYPNPFPDGFYSGDTTHYEFIGLRESYYAWEWGDALFVALDPYWYTAAKPGKNNNWGWTLGERQYRWLRRILESSNAVFKFVFCHHLVGGSESARGGIEFASYYEWGGLNPDGTRGFDEHRPGWGKSIHQLLVENNVSIFFHGHDHFFAKQNLDGVVYQLVPHPGHANFSKVGQAEQYGYSHGVILPNSGHIRVEVSESNALVDYIRAYRSEDEGDGRRSGEVAYSYEISAIDTTTSVNSFPALPENYDLAQNTPNPFNPGTTITFQVPTFSRVSIIIYDILGRNVRTLVDGQFPEGRHTIEWNGLDNAGNQAGCGVYFYCMETGGFIKAKKALLLR